MGRSLHLFGIAAVLFPQSGTFLQYTFAAHVTSNHETCHVQSEWEETLCLDVCCSAASSTPFLWTCFAVLSQPRGYYGAFATARVGCSAGREFLPEGTARAEVFCAFHFIRRAAGRSCCVSIIAGPGRHMQAGWTHDSCIYSSLFSVKASGRARGCCAGVLRRRAGGPRGGHNLCKDTSHDL